LKLDWVASAEISGGLPLTLKKNTDVVIYQKLETGKKIEHDRKHEKSHILLHRRCSFFFSTAGVRERERGTEIGREMV
jgi:hypothetical protein